MKKEEILEMSRRDNKKRDVYEIEVETKGCKLAALLMIILASFYYCYEIFTGKGQNYSFYSIIAIYCASLYGYKALKLESRKKLHIFCAIVWGFITIISMIGYFD